jgi:type IX secretion system PorP/SprF family membrane protein
MKRILPLSLILVSLAASAQQEAQFTHFTWNQLVFNPAYAGSRDAICATLVYHNQWAAFSGPDMEGAPITKTFSITAPVRQGFGVGIHVVDDREGFIGTTGAYVSGAYRFTLPFGADLSIGVNGGMIQKLLEPDWHAANPTDPRLPGTSSSTGFDAGAGVHLLGANWYVGASSLHIPQSRLAWQADSAKVDYPVESSYWFTAAYNQQDLMGGKLELRPAVLVKTDFTKTEFAVNMQALINKRFFAAINYRAETLTAISAMGGLYITPGWAVGYSFDIPTDNASIFGGTHELMVQYCIDVSKIGIDWPWDDDVWHKDTRHL